MTPPAVDVFFRLSAFVKKYAGWTADFKAHIDRLNSDLSRVETTARKRLGATADGRIADIKSKLAALDSDAHHPTVVDAERDCASLKPIMHDIRVVVVPWPEEGRAILARARAMVGAPADLQARLPFEATMLLFDCDPRAALARYPEEGGYTAGYLALRDGRMWTIEVTDIDPGTKKHGGPLMVVPLLQSDADGIDVGALPDMWILWAYLDAMNAHKIAPIRAAPSFGTRRAASKAGVVPPPYYPVAVGGALVRSRLDAAHHEQRAWSHRWDVRRHRRLLVRRGVGTCPDADALRQRGYQAAAVDDVEIATALAERGMPPRRAGEWLAYRWVLVREHIRGPDDAPYVPATRVVDVVGGAP